MLLTRRLRKTISIGYSFTRELIPFHGVCAIFKGRKSGTGNWEFDSVLDGRNRKLRITVSEGSPLPTISEHSNASEGADNAALLIQQLVSMDEDNFAHRYFNYTSDPPVSPEEIITQLKQPPAKEYTIILLDVSNAFDTSIQMLTYKLENEVWQHSRDYYLSSAASRINPNILWKKRNRMQWTIQWALFPFLLDLVTFPLQLFLFRNMVR